MNLATSPPLSQRILTPYPASAPAVEYNYIIAGAGCAGCGLANRLSASREHRGPLLKTGEDERWMWIKIPAGIAHILIGEKASDMILMPDASTAIVDPFFADATVNIRCDIIEPATMKGYERDPRSLGKSTMAKK